MNELLYFALSSLAGTTTSKTLQSYLDTEIRRMQLTAYYSDDEDYSERFDNLTAVIARKWYKLSEQEQLTITNLYIEYVERTS